MSLSCRSLDGSVETGWFSSNDLVRAHLGKLGGSKWLICLGSLLLLGWGGLLFFLINVRQVLWGLIRVHVVVVFLFLISGVKEIFTSSSYSQDRSVVMDVWGEIGKPLAGFWKGGQGVVISWM